METKTKKGVCDVCKLVNGDTSIKEVSFCNVCKKWICKKCSNRWDRRTIAAFLNGMMGLSSFISNKK